eukprot:1161973-Pelagomonas_calceolata.AAC.19
MYTHTQVASCQGSGHGCCSGGQPAAAAAASTGAATLDRGTPAAPAAGRHCEQGRQGGVMRGKAQVLPYCSGAHLLPRLQAAIACKEDKG